MKEQKRWSTAHLAHNLYLRHQDVITGDVIDILINLSIQ